MSPPDGSRDRDGAAADEFVRESFRDIKRTLEIIQQQLSYLPQHYVSRAEFDRHRDELVVDLAGSEKQREKDIASVRTEIRDIRLDLKDKADKADLEEVQDAQKDKSDKAFTIKVALASVAVGLPGAFYAFTHLTAR